MVRAEANMASHAKSHGMLTVMANYASATGGFPTGGRSAVWNEQGMVVVRAPPQGECFIIAQQAADGWAGKLVTP